MMTAKEFREVNRDKFGFDGNAMLDAWNEYFKDHAEIGDGATLCYWSDSEAFTIIKRTAQSLTLQRDKATLDPGFKPVFIPRGFCGTVINQDEQSYTYERDENGQVIVARWSKKKGRFFWHGLCVIPERHEFYDYNF